MRELFIVKFGEYYETLNGFSGIRKFCIIHLVIQFRTYSYRLLLR